MSAGSRELSSDKLVIPCSLMARIELESRLSFPIETCGLLLGVRRGATVQVFAVRQSPNLSLDDRAKSYFVPIEWLMWTQREVRASGWHIVGAYHSHPHAGPIPSRRDVDEAWPEFVYLIASLAQEGGCQTRAWQFSGRFGAFEAVPMIIEAECG